MIESDGTERFFQWQNLHNLGCQPTIARSHTLQKGPTKYYGKGFVLYIVITLAFSYPSSERGEQH